MKSKTKADYREEKDRWLAEVVKKAVLSAPTSPCTTKCPDPAIIRDLVFHKPVAPEITKDVALHLTECPDCARIALTYREEYREQKENSV